MTFVMLYTKDGQYFCLQESDYTDLKGLRYDDEGFSVFHMASNGAEVYLRVEDIQSFLLSTPETRAASVAWEKELNGTEEEEKQSWE